MNYVFPNEIKNARCTVLNSPDIIYNYPNLRTRQTWIRSGSKWYKAGSYTSYQDMDISSYVCLDVNNIEYEYSFIEPIFYTSAFLIAGLALFSAFYLIIYRLFKGGMKW